MEPLPRSRRDVLAPVRDSPDKRFGDAEDALRAAAEIEIVADVGSGERAELRRRESLQTAPRAGIDVDFGSFRQGDAAAVGKHEGDRNIAPAIAAGDDLRELPDHADFRLLGTLEHSLAALVRTAYPWAAATATL